jgi:hypothetical protein
VCVSGWLGGLKNTIITEGTQRFILVRAIGALRPAADDPYTQEHPKSEGYNRVEERDLVGDHSVLILRSLTAGEAFPLVGEEEDNRSGGGALGPPLWVALLSVQSSTCSVRTRMIYLRSLGNRPPPS